MKLSRFFKTIFMTDFVGGLLIAIKEFLNQKKQLIILLKKEKLAHDLEVNMP
jgi:NADH-quinone oxidoreductase subunit I